MSKFMITGIDKDTRNITVVFDVDKSVQKLRVPTPSEAEKTAKDYSDEAFVLAYIDKYGDNYEAIKAREDVSVLDVDGLVGQKFDMPSKVPVIEPIKDPVIEPEPVEIAPIEDNY